MYPGKKYDDACLSDVQVYVTATTPDNPAYEKQHFEQDPDLEEGARRSGRPVQDGHGQVPAGRRRSTR